MLSRRRKLLIAGAAGLLLLLVFGKMAAEFVTELLWYQALGHDQVFWTRWSASLGARGLLALLIGAFVYLNLWVVTRSLGVIRVRRRYANIEIAERLPQSYVVGALLLVSLFSAWWLSVGVSDAPEVLAALRPVAWGVDDPVFGRDLSFYLLRLPLLNRLQTLAGLLVFWTALLATAAYVATGALRLQDGRPRASTLAVRHLGLLAAALLLVIAWDAWLDRYGLLIAGSGVGGAFGYTDAHARLPGKLLVMLTAVAAAGAVGYVAWTERRLPPAAGLVALLLVVLGSQVAYPSAVQNFTVEPNEFPRERPYIARHLAFTRLAYGLADLRRERLPYNAPVNLHPEPLLAAVDGVPLWDERPLLDVFAQRQALRQYYQFASVYSDRYGPLDQAEQVAIAVRELDVTQLDQRSRTWQNLHLEYVSGEGVVVSPVSEMTGDGAPLYYLSDLDPPKLAPDAPPGLRLEQPEIYFGEMSSGYVFVEQGDGPVGIPLDAAWKRWLLAWAFQSRNLLLSGQLDEQSVLLYRRQVVDRVLALAPFLHVPEESGAYPVLLDGRVTWVVDGLTTSLHFPLAPVHGLGSLPVRYARNSVKATVDAVTGEVRFYVTDAADAVLRSYARWFPELFRPASEMPGDLARHLRFPPALMELQAEVLSEYHLPDERTFYAKEDVWRVATENYRGSAIPVEPTFAMLQLPGAERREFVLTVPLVTVGGRQNLTALLVTRNDPPAYGEQVLYELPRDELVPGPQQVEAMIDQDPEISQQLSLWRQGGSNVIRGHLIVVPFDSTLVYVEPLFLEAENAAIPQLERVILATSRRVVMRPTLEGAVQALAAGLPPTLRAEAAPAEPGAGADIDRAEAPDAARPAAGAAAPTDQRIRRARQLLEDAEQRLRQGDLEGFGRRWRELHDLLRPAERDTVARLPLARPGDRL